MPNDKRIHAPGDVLTDRPQAKPAAMMAAAVAVNHINASLWLAFITVPAIKGPAMALTV